MTELRHDGLYRRHLLRGLGAVCSLSALTPALALAGPDQQADSPNPLQFRNLHTSELFSCTHCHNEAQALSQLPAFNYIMRDWRNNEVPEVDPRLLVMLSTLHQQLQARHPITLLSGYRSLETNEMLRQQRVAVARNSYHTRAQAIDFLIPGIPLRRLRDAARGLEAGGVGYYPGSGFIHLDTGPVRYWS